MSVSVQEQTPLVDALADVGIRPKSFHEGVQHQMVCPKCHGGSETATCLTLTIDRNSKGAVWCCHRGTCGWSDNLIIGGRHVVPFSHPARIVRKPPVVPVEDQQKPDKMYAYFAKRGIERETVDAFGIYRSTHYFHKKGDRPEGIYPAIVFPYRWKGEVTNRKYRSAHKQQIQEKDPLHTLYNIDSIYDATGEVIESVVWVEGEIDCLAVTETSWKAVVSLKDGTPPKRLDENDPKREFDRRYEAMATHGNDLDKVKRFYLAGDNDQPGLLLREELARRLGRHRCWIVTWPPGCKDAAQTLEEQGYNVVEECIHNAKPYPIQDVQEITGLKLAEYLDLPAPRVLKTGITALDQVIKFPGEGRLIVITGVPNAGKSALMMAAMMRLMSSEGRRFLVFSPEMQPWEEFCVMCAQILMGKQARKGVNWIEGDPVLTVEEQIRAGDWMNARMRFLASDSEDQAPTLEWILERGREAAMQLGITDLLIDPWNEIEHQRSGMTETDYTGRALQKAKAFAYRHGCNVWVVVHPAKMKPAVPGEVIQPPGPYDINGSANFANKTDIGITVHTPENTTSIIVWKSRFQRWGRKGSTAELDFHPSTGRYVSPPQVEIKYGLDAWGFANLD